MGRLIRLADDLQVISTRVDDFRVEPEAFDLVAAARAAAQRVEALDPGRPLTLNAPAKPVMVRVDPARLDQILDNLLKNAMAYSPRESAIEISAGAEAGHATIRVRDHGPGILAADRERIFERFARGAAAANQPGMGIGAVCQQGDRDAHGRPPLRRGELSGRVRLYGRAAARGTLRRPRR